jgi:tetratricopeptide (TPR) repeat protein
MKATAVSDAPPAQAQPEPVESVSASTLHSLADLRRAIVRAKGAGFSLFIAVCNQPNQRVAAMQALKKSLPEWHCPQAALNADTTSVLAVAQSALEPGDGRNAVSPDALVLDGLEQVVRRKPDNGGPEESQPVLEGLNLERDGWRRDVPIPVVLWTSDFLLPLLARHAPDFLDWRSGTVLFPSEISTDIEVALDGKNFGDHVDTALTPEMRRARLRELEDRIATFDEGDKHLAAIQAQWLEEGAGHAARLGEPVRAEQLMNHALKMWRSVGEPRGEAEALITQGQAWLAAGDLLRAQALFHSCLVITERLARQDPSNALWQRDLSVVHNRLGDVQRAQGNLAASLASFRKGLEFAEQLAGQDSSNADWKRDLCVSYVKLAEVSEKTCDEISGEWWRKAFAQLSSMKEQRLFISPKDERLLEFLRQKTRMKAQEAAPQR